MNKADLKAKWSKYCDTDKLVNNTMKLLKDYGHKYTEHGVCVLLDKYFAQKEPLIKLFATSKNYIGDMRIVVTKDFDRNINGDEIYYFFRSFHSNIDTNQMLKNTDANGKVMMDYLFAGKHVFNLDNLPSAEMKEEQLAKLRQFDYRWGDMAANRVAFLEFSNYVNYFAGVYYSTLQKDYTADKNKKEIPLLKCGTKTSRAFNKVCNYYGVDQFKQYNKLFAQYADLVSDLSRKMRFVISLNPLDYLTMSHGVSWQSCHNIRNGGWKGGTLSYMLDTTSIITFVIDNTEGPIHTIPKYYRQMYHYENSLFIQNRLYPQGNDGATNLYEKFRGFIIEEFADLLHIDGDWATNIGPGYCTQHIIESKGKHYRDYNHNSSCSIFYPKAKANTALGHKMTIGHEGICVNCGAEHSVSGRLNHQYSSDCNFKRDYEDFDSWLDEL